MARNTRRIKQPQRDSKTASTPKMTSAPHQAKPNSNGPKVTQYLVESRVHRPRAGILRKRASPPKSSNLFPGVDDRRSGRWIWVLWIFPVGAVAAYFAAHTGASMVERDFFSPI